MALDLSAFDTTQQPTEKPQLDTSAFDQHAAPAGNDTQTIKTDAFEQGAGINTSAFSAPEEKRETHEDVEKLPNRGTANTVGSSDLDYIAKKHGVDPQFLKDWVGWLGGVTDPRERTGAEHVTETAKSFAGAVGEGVGMGIPQGLVKKWGLDEQKQKALDDLGHLVEERKSFGQSLGDIALGVAAPVSFVGGAGKTLSTAQKIAHAGEAVGLGAGIGYAHSDTGHELEGTLWGAGTGGLLALGGAGVGKVLSKRAANQAEKLAPEAETAVQDTMKQAREAFEANQPHEDVLADVVLNNKDARAAARGKDVAAFLESTTPEQRAAMSNLGPEEMKLPTRRFEGTTDEDYRAFMVMRENLGQLDKELGTGVRRGGVRDVQAQEGAEHVAERFAGIRKSEYVSHELSKLPEDILRGLSTPMKAVAFYSEAPRVYDAIDTRLGTRLSPAFDRLSKAINFVSRDMHQVSGVLKPLYKALGVAEKQPTLLGEKFSMWTALQEPEQLWARKYTPEQTDAIKQWREGFDWLRQKANKMGLPIEQFEGGYVPHKVVDARQFVQKMEETGEKLGIHLGDVSRGTVAVDENALAQVLKDADRGGALAKEYVQGLKMASAGRVEDVASARKAINEMFDLSRTGHRLETTAGASFEREGNIPEWLLEKDVSKLFPKWAQSTFRHIRMRKPLTEVRQLGKVIEKVHPEAGGYINRHIEDLVGIREGSMEAAKGEWLAGKQLKYERLARKAGLDTPAGQMWHLVSKVPDIVPMLSNQLYSYSLGARVDKLFENSFQFVMLGIPSTGARSVTHWAGGVYDLFTNFAKSPGKIKELLEKKGLAPAEQPFEAGKWLREGLERSVLKRGGSQLLELSNRLAMSLYTQTDLLNRGITYYAAQRIARSMESGEASALKIIKEMGPGYQMEVREKLARGEKVGDDIAAWLNSYTQFNYNRATMSEYGRYMGNFFATFSKWPTAVVGDLAYRADKVRMGHGQVPPEVFKGVMRYLAPLVALRAAGAAYTSFQDGATRPDEIVQKLLSPSSKEFFTDHPRQSQVIGRDFEHIAPIGTVTSPMEGGIFAAPAPRAGVQVAKSILAGDVHGTAKTVLRVASPFMPFGVWMRFIMKDIPGWQNQEVPQESPMELLGQKAGLDLER